MARTVSDAPGVPKPSLPFIPGSAVSWHWDTMTERKTLFRRVFESMIDGRTRQAQRHITEYLRAHPVKDEWRR